MRGTGEERFAVDIWFRDVTMHLVQVLGRTGVDRIEQKFVRQVGRRGEQRRAEEIFGSQYYSSMVDQCAQLQLRNQYDVKGEKTSWLGFEVALGIWLCEHVVCSFVFIQALRSGHPRPN